MTLDSLRRMVGNSIAQPLAPILARMGLTPNVLTLLGLALSGAAAWAIVSGRLILAGSLILVGGLFDLLDGAVARVTRGASSFGALLDSVVDRVSEAVVFLGILLMMYAEQPSSNVEMVLVLVALAGSFLVSYVRARAEGLGIECKVGWFTRTERVILLAIGLMLNQIFIVLVVLSVLTFFTVVQRVAHCWRRGARTGVSRP